MDAFADADERIETPAPAAPDAASGEVASPRPARFGRDAAAIGRAFVVQLTLEATADAFCGRVQQLATLDGGNFSSPDGLIAIIRRVLERRPAREGPSEG